MSHNQSKELKDVELVGTPIAPTASSATNTTQIATTAFVQTVVSGSSSGSRISVSELSSSPHTISTQATSVLELVYYVDSTSAFTVNLPVASATGQGLKINIKQLNSGIVTVTCQASDYIDVSSQTSINLNQYDSLTFVSDTSNSSSRWLLI